MQSIPLEPGMRVRCVDDTERPCNDKHARLTKGREYEVLSLSDQFVVIEDDLGGMNGGWWPDRFKPIVRVKAKCVPSLSVLLRRSAAAVNRMSPAEKDAMVKAQGESWARGEAALAEFERATHPLFGRIHGQ